MDKADIIINPAIKLFDIGKKTGDKKYTDAAKKAVNFCLNMQRPEAGDYWKTPLHAANPLSAGHASLAPLTMPFRIHTTA